MVFHIAKKDFLNNLHSARFVIGFLLCFILIPFSIVINIADYREKTIQYKVDADAAEKGIKEVRVYSALRPEIVLPPEPLSIFSRGISGQVGNRVKIRIGDKPLLAAGKTAAGDNPFLGSFFSIDFVEIAAIVFSLLALLFGYDAFTREKEDGTLKMQMSNSLSRSRLLAGKVLGILLTLLPIMIFCFLFSAVLVLLSKNVTFSAFEWGRIGLLFLISLAYLAVFIFLGVFISARSRSSVTSLVFCLFIWVFFIFIVPNVSAYLAESFVPVPSRDNLDRVVKDLNQDLDRQVRQRLKAQDIPTGINCWWCNSGDDGFFETYGNPRADFEVGLRRIMISEPLRIDYADRKWAPQKRYLDGLIGQSRVAERVSMISPAGLFRIVAEAVCSTGVRGHESDMDRARRYRETFIGFLRNKNIFASYRYITAAPPETFSSEDRLIELRSGGEFKTARQADEWAAKQKNRRAAWARINRITVPGDQPGDFPFLDVSDMPRFPARPQSFASGLTDSIVPLGALLIECIFLFALGYVAFVRFDVR
jgi:ABC-type transport system involved in multi-copper enzyme maturation permease subunit